MRKFSTIIKDTFGHEKRFVNWKLEKKKDKQTKIPYSPITGRMASSTDAATWGTYEEARAADAKIGIVFTPEQNLLGIDIDHCLNGLQIIHEQEKKIFDLIEAADTYTEISPSETGIHLLLKLSAPLKLVSNKKAPFEAYTSGRYFTMTETALGAEKPIREVTPEQALELLAIIGYPWKKDEPVLTQSKLNGAIEFAKIQSPEKGERMTHAAAADYVDVNGNAVLDDDEIVQRMIASKHGAEIKSLMDGNISKYKNDASVADLALCSHLAFWTGRDAMRMERIWMSTIFGGRKKTVERADYRARTIATAIAGCKEVYESHRQRQEQELKVAAPDIEFIYTLNARKEKVFILNTENICRILRAHPDFKGNLRYDIFKNSIEVCVDGKWRAIGDDFEVVLQTKISILFPIFGTVGKQMTFDALKLVAMENSIDSAADWATALVWDKKKRLDTWLCKTYGVPDDKYHRAVAANVLKGAIKRIMFPGCKFDYVLVLEGEQGTKKSSSLRILAGEEWYVETTMGTDSKDFFMQFAGKLFVEFSEGETLNKTEAKKMKAIITTQIDKYRPPYERVSRDFPRRCIFAMTTNQEEYLKDETGNRRWLPVTVVFKDGADLEWLAENREQMYAEAYYRVMIEKETIYEFPKEETKKMQESRQMHDPTTEAVCDWYINELKESDKMSGVTVQQVCRDALYNGFHSKPMTRQEDMSIAYTLKNVLKLVRVRKMVKGVQSWRWFETGHLSPIQEEDMTTEKAVEEELGNWGKA